MACPAFLAQTADRNRALGRFFLADHQQDRDLGEGVLAHFVIDFLVAQVAFHAQAEFSRGLDRFVGELIRIGTVIVATTACTGDSQSGKWPA